MFRGLFDKVTRRVAELFTGRRTFDESLFEELEETLIESDVGPQTATKLVASIREAARRNRLASAEEVIALLKREIAGILDGDTAVRWPAQPPALVLVVGVNGTGKTTTIAKLARFFQRQGRTVLLAAADTFRAAAIDQLAIWAERVGADMVRHREGADPAAVVYDAVQAARARGIDAVIADTAGRLHTRSNLMEELKKVHRVAERALGRPADEVLLVLDATIGQNAVSQARSFGETLPLTGIVLTKMDGTARGGVILTVKDELGVPIKFVGVGEKVDDLHVFRPEAFTEALFAEPAES